MSRRLASSLVSAPGLLVVALLVYLPISLKFPLTRAEAMYALIPREMLASGSWLTPYLNGVHYLDKPQLLYWLNLLAYHLLGPADWVARLVCLSLAMTEIWLAYLIGRRLFGPRPAWLGGFILLSSVGFFTLHLQILTDHLVTVALAASCYFLLRWQEEPRNRWAALFHLSLVAGFLSKGFIGVVFPLLIGGLYAAEQRQPRFSRLFCCPRGLGLLLILIIPWFVGVEQANPGFLKHQIINEQVMRFLGHRQPADIAPYSVGEFWLFAFIWLLPWTFLLPGALYRFWQDTRPGGGTDSRARLLLIWAGVVMSFFTLSASRVEYYSLPAFLPLALVLGWRVDRRLSGAGRRSFTWALIMLASLGVGHLFLLPHLEQLCAANRPEFAGLGTLIRPFSYQTAILVPGLAIFGLLAGPRRPRLAVASLSALSLVLVCLTCQCLLTLSPVLSDKVPGEYVRAQAAPEDVLVMEYNEEFEYGASFSFYARRHILMVQRDGMPRFPYPVPAPQNYLISPERLRELWQGPRRVFLLIDHCVPREPFLAGAQVALSLPGKSLLVNQ
jgi:4-amino-4-deoxy-L-arabinose transferase-like glycosyltransferase